MKYEDFLHEVKHIATLYSVLKHNVDNLNHLCKRIQDRLENLAQEIEKDKREPKRDS